MLNQTGVQCSLTDASKLILSTNKLGPIGGFERVFTKKLPGPKYAEFSDMLNME